MQAALARDLLLEGLSADFVLVTDELR